MVSGHHGEHSAMVVHEHCLIDSTVLAGMRSVCQRRATLRSVLSLRRRGVEEAGVGAIGGDERMRLTRRCARFCAWERVAAGQSIG